LYRTPLSEETETETKKASNEAAAAAAAAAATTTATKPETPDAAKLKDDDLVLQAAALLSDGCARVRLAATHALASHGAAAKRATDALLPNLASRDAFLREKTLRALASIWGDVDFAVAAAASANANANATETTTNAAAEASPAATTKSEPAERVVVDDASALAAAAPAAAAVECAAAADVAAANRAKEAADRAKEALDAPGKALVALAARRAFDDADGGVREAGAELMGLLKAHATPHVDALNRLMSGDGDEGVRDAATDALVRLGYYNPWTKQVKSRG
jgi:SWI/SNF-related matrix-associated actin-dependent regulator 1 of chromatin subfamily A